MDYNLLMQKDQVIESFFYVYIDTTINEVFCSFDEKEMNENIASLYDSMQKIFRGNEALEDEEYSGHKILEEKDLIKLELEISKPDFNTNMKILKNCTTSKDGIPNIDSLDYNRMRILFLLKDWCLKDSSGKKITINSSTIGELHPNIVTYLAKAINKNIPHYLNIFTA